ncbi:O-antigen polymerase [Streptococcus sp. sy010]|uniref:O-antigen polymerase n=1 Tax=Streptococcus sp. sy010 TaxID=2600148 RepID=UPI0011B7F086|nr:O-antigen polymerase [Streptococcus sp. sy010]TWT14436.1 oligosaccharide repeat unit polymerase [Streptococcus sp. sy010]
MVLSIIIILSLLFLIFNYYISDNDFLAPSIVFILMFLVQSVMCLIATSYLNITFNMEVLIILLISYLIFTIFNVYNAVILKKTTNVVAGIKTATSRKLYFLPLSSSVSWIINGLSVLLIYSNYKFLQRLSNAYGGTRSLSEMISLYDRLTKFRPEVYRSLGVHRPFYYTALSLLVLAGSYLTIYILVNNFIVNKKINWLQMLTAVLLIIEMYFSGSRSPIFRVITFVAFLYYIFSIRNGLQHRERQKIFSKFLRWGIVLTIVFLSTLSLYGRSNSYSLFHYFFIYVGAPLWNLDTFIQTHSLPQMTQAFGEQTFIAFHNSFLRSGFLLDLPFVKANAAYGLGNVYTTFYQFLHDFGWLGLVPLVTIIVWYYSGSYRKILMTKNEPVIDFRLFVYAYLINDLIMLFFSNRFYETILQKNTIRLFIVAYLISSILFEQAIKIGPLKISFRKQR